MDSRRAKPLWQIKIAEKRIRRLMDLAEEVSIRGDLEMGRRYVYLARKIAEKFNIRIGRKYGKRFCRRCNVYFTSSTLKVRTNSTQKVIEYRCMKCGYVRRYPYRV